MQKFYFCKCENFIFASAKILFLQVRKFYFCKCENFIFIFPRKTQENFCPGIYITKKYNEEVKISK
ncbi:Uncharacterized protein dnm_079220 [Desulfonema magnum]|uniref:Uncharacterized protein n=1 Tax=Desulfonema magnum TaxID=45655 RepID=A0A975BV44_9BACT|nr:Uncharacterized protein dnm_079220 [Desulfonema magnum]